MLFSRNSKIALILAVLFFIASCAPTSGGKRDRDDNITLLEDAELQTTEEYAQAYEDEQSQEDSESEEAEQQFDEYGNLVEPEQQFDEYGNLIEPESQDVNAEESQDVNAEESQGSFVVQQNVGEIAEESLPEEEAVSVDVEIDEVIDDQAVNADEQSPAMPIEPVVIPKISIEERFGPNPYLANPPIILEQAKVDFTEALALLRAEAETKLAEKDDSKKFESKAEEVEVKVPETEATTKMKAVVDNYPALSGPAYNLAFYYYQLDFTGEALKYLDISTSRNYYNLEAHNLKAKIYRDKSDFEKAEKAYKDAISAWAGFLPAYKNIGIMYDLYMGQPEKAYEYYKQYNEYNPEEDRQVVGWAVVLERKMKAIQARKNAEAAALVEQQQAEAQVAAEAAGGTSSQDGVDQGQVAQDNAAVEQQDSQIDAQEAEVTGSALDSEGNSESTEQQEAVDQEPSALDQALESAEENQASEAEK